MTDQTSPTHIGIAGCGRMGLPMGRALARAGLTVTGYDRRWGDDFPGLRMMFDARDFIMPITHLFVVVRDSAEIEALLFTQDALLEQAHALRYLVICSTVPPGFVRDLARRLPRAVRLIDAPMSGAQVAAENAELTFMTGGAPEDVEAVTLFLSQMGDRFHHLGPLGAGMTAKVLNNLVAAASAAATRTALDWGEAEGIAPAQLLSVMNDSSGQTWFGTGFDAIEFARDGYDPHNSIGLLVKDLACAETLAPDGQSLTGALSETLARLEKLRD